MKWLAMGLAVIVAALAIVLGRAAAQNAGVDLIRRECSTCHGARGVSISPMFPNLAAQQAAYVAVQLKAFRDRSRADPHAQAYMWGMAAQLTDGTIAEIADYFAAQPPAKGTPTEPAEGAAGKKIFEDGIAAQQVPPCQSCHMKDAEGNAMFPRLAGQHRPYLEKQLELFATGLRANPIMHENAKNLTALQISQVAAYLSSR
jgi:cytochrome c553